MSTVPLIFALGMLWLGSVVAAWTWASGQKLSGRRVLVEGDPPAVPWGAVSVCLCVLLFLGTQLMGVVVLVAADPGRFHPGKAPAAGTEITPVEIMSLSAASNLALVLVVPALLRSTAGAHLADLGLRGRPVGRNLIRGAVAYALICPLVLGLMLGATRVWQPNAHPIQQMLTVGRSWRLAALAFASAVVLAPLAEELLFRAVLLGWLRRRAEALGKDGWHMAAPNLITSLLFAGMHYQQWPSPIPLFALSIALGLLYQRTGSLWAPVALHACQNGVATAMLVLISRASG